MDMMNLLIKNKMMKRMKKMKKIGEDDPRRIIHCIKVGLALTLVSLLYYCRPLYTGFGQAGIWAVITVVVVFEYTVGGTLSKGINRGCATLAGGALGIGAVYLATLCGDKGHPIVLGLFIFLLGAASTFTRFLPSVKKRYDYGVPIFILTFTLVAVSCSRVDQVLEAAHQRLSTILIGGVTCMGISIFIFPVWAGQDLHNLIVEDIEKLATFLEGFEGEFCTSQEDKSYMVSSKDDKDRSYLQSYKSVLNSRGTEESLANFAWWEPGHGGFRFHHPWEQYLNIGALATECAYHMEALRRCINSKPQVSSEFPLKIQPICIKMGTESANALKELASAMKNMTSLLPTGEIHIQNSKAAANDLKIILENSSLPTKVGLQEIMPLLVIAYALMDIIKCVEKISVSVYELSQEVGWQKPKSQQQLLQSGIMKPVDDHKVIDITKTFRDLPEKKIHS